MIELERYRERLRRRRNAIVEALAQLEDEQRSESETKELVDRAADAVKQRIAGSLAESYRSETMRIDEALERSRRGEYGTCVACHEPIGRERLETTPEAAFCAECQKLRELVQAR